LDIAHCWDCRAVSIDGRSSAAAATIHVNHWCSVAGCETWGGFGHASSKSIETQWWCWEHYPYKPSATTAVLDDLATQLQQPGD